MAGPVGVRAHLLGPEPVRPAVGGIRPGRRPREAVRPRHVPVPERRGPPRGASARLHRDRRVRPLQADDRLQCPPRHGLRRIRPPGRAVRRPDRSASAGHHRGQHREHAAAAACARARTRLPSGRGHHRRVVLPVDAVDLPADLQLLVRRRRATGAADQRADPDPRGGSRCRVGRSRPDRAPEGRRRQSAGISLRAAGELVPGARHRPRQRRGHRRGAQRTRQPPGPPAADEAVDAADHGLQRPAPRRSRSPRLVRVDQDDATQLDRSQRRRRGRLRGPGPRRRRDHRVHHPARHPVRRDLHGAGTRAPTRRRDHRVGVARRHAPARHRRHPDGVEGHLRHRQPSCRRRFVGTASSRPRRASSSGRPRVARRPVCSPARSRSTPRVVSRSRSSSPTTC